MILETINSPADVKCLSEEQTATLCRELRSFLVEQVSRTGGHLASNLGVVELTVAIHRVFDTATDRLVLDVADCQAFPSPMRVCTTPLWRGTRRIRCR